jgi:hypothetical protein
MGLRHQTEVHFDCLPGFVLCELEIRFVFVL